VILSPISVEERLDAAAWRILNDGRWHAPQATAWAQGRLQAQRGRAIINELYGRPLAPAERRYGRRRPEW
jgi:hypothetical protein